MTKPVTLVAFLLLVLPFGNLQAAEGSIPAAVSDTANKPDLPSTPGTYWLRNSEGWFWYRDPPAAPRPPKASPVPQSRPRELVEFEAMQKRLDELKRIAVMNPSDSNLLGYMSYQRMVMNKSEVFAQSWQRLVWTTPELDYGLTGRPTNSTAI